MMSDDQDQDKLAQEWADALTDDSDGGDPLGGDPGDGNDEALADEWAAALAEDTDGGGGGGDDDALADEWAAALGEQDDEPGDAGAGSGGGGDEGLADEWAAALAEDTGDDIRKEKEQEFLRTQTRDVDFKDLTSEAKNPRHDGSRRDLDFILDIPLDVSAELGRSKMLINELLQLGTGSVVELSKLAGEPLEIYVNGKLVARGEAVVINEKFGIRLTDIISPIERVKHLA
ncbi:Flagellar motor switch protein FliN [Maridesulfovibrio hydrothermalis AM13 = DSM 14728]|uniref:Flagellar motor switch protein FliN n=1 Tax=Maridesulfovibrio hydrothermalis AM13 = DSM 14728 TaxID=1121451 RepID=L0R8F6_9BACT|nr:flagellar motor switch protein FliN [Maridesulfovibrio hydrothermalis]CCO23034.1 Flagellar motor switch protein FliN [Maridesulfovibrio hydrothermalis AM13 = DSM 14728]